MVSKRQRVSAWSQAAQAVFKMGATCPTSQFESPSLRPFVVPLWSCRMTLFARTATVIEQLEARLASWTLVDTDPTGSKAELDAIATDSSAIASNVRKLETNAKETNPDRRVYNAETAAKVLALVARFDAFLQHLEQQRPRAEAAAAAEATRREEAAQRRAVEEAARRAKEEEEAARQRAVHDAQERVRCVSRRCTRTSAPSINSLC